jgi:NADP-reducing hydrogenase subunit HndB
MSKLKSFDELKKLQQEIKSMIEIMGDSGGSESFVQVRVAMATCGLAAGARQVFEFFTEQLDRRNIDAIVTQTGCMGYCYAEPTVEVKIPDHDPVVFGGVDLRKADEIIEKYIKTGELVDGIIPVNYETIDSKS